MGKQANAPAYQYELQLNQYRVGYKRCQLGTRWTTNKEDRRKVTEPSSFAQGDDAYC